MSLPVEQHTRSETRNPRRRRVRLAVLVGVSLLFAGFLFSRLLPHLAVGLLRGALPWPGASLALERLQFHGFHGVTLTGLRLTLSDGGSATIDTVAAEFLLSEILREPRRIRRLRVVAPAINANRGPTGWPWLAPFLTDTAPAEPPDSGQFLVVDRVELVGGSMDARDGDRSILGISELHSAGALSLGSDPALELTPLRLEARPSAPGTGLSIRGGLSMRGDQWKVDSLTAISSSGGTLSLAGSAGPAGSDGRPLDLRITADSFQLGLLPFLDDVISPRQRAAVDATLRGTTSRPEGTIQAEFAGAGGTKAESHVDLTGATPQLRFNATVRGLDLDRITGGAVPIPALTGTLDGRLAVDNADSLSGPVTLDLRSVAPGSARIAGRADFTRGLAEVTFDATVGDVDARLRGRVRPFGVSPSWDLEAHGRSRLPLPAAVVEREPSWPGPWRMQARLNGTGMSADSLRGSLTARLEPDRPGPRVGPLDVTFEAGGGQATIEARGELGGGRIEGSARLGLADPARSWEIRRAALADFALGPWTAEQLAQRVDASGSARASGNGARGQFRLEQTRGGHLAGLTGEMTFLTAGQRIELSGRFDRDSQQVRLDTLILLDGAPSQGLLHFTSLDPAAFDTRLPPARLTGQFRFDPLPQSAPVDTNAAWVERLALSGRVDLTGSELNGRPIGGQLEGRIAAGSLDFELAFSGAGELTARGSTRLTGGTALRLEEARFRALDLAGWLGDSWPAGGLSGQLSGEVAGTEPATARADLTLILDSTAMGAVRIDSARVGLQLRDGELTLRGGAARDTFRLTTDLGARVQPDGRWRGRGALRLADQIPEDSATALEIRAGFTSPDSTGGGGWRVDLTGHGAVAGIQLDSLTAGLALERDLLRVDRLRLRGPGFQLDGGGRTALDRSAGGNPDLGVQGRIEELEPFLDLAGFPGYSGELTIDFAIGGTGRAPETRLSLDIRRLQGEALRLDAATVTLRARADSSSMLAEVVGDIEIAGDRPVLVGPGLPLILIGPGIPGAAGGNSIRAGLAWEARAAKQVRLQAVEARFEGEPWQLTAPATITWGDSLIIEPLRLASGATRHLELGGRLSRRGVQDLSLDIAGFPLQFRGRDASEAMTGRLALRLGLTGPAASPRLVVEGAILGLQDTTRPVSFGAEWTAEGMSLHAAKTQAAGGRLSLTGALPIGLSLVEEPVTARAEESVSFTVEAAAFGLSDLEPLLPTDFSDLRGQLDARVRLSGSADAPRFTGEVSVNRFRLRSRPYGTAVSSDRLALRLDGTRVVLSEGTLTSANGGPLTLSGSVDIPRLSDIRLGLDARFQGFRAADSRALEAVLSGSLHLGGTVAAPEVSGRLTADKATYWISGGSTPPDLEQIELTAADTREIERRFRVDGGASGGAGVWDATAIDLTVSARNDVWARRRYDPALAVEVTGEVQVSKTRGGDLRLLGSIQVVPGRSHVEEFGRRFAIASGTVRFQGPADSVELEARATYQPTANVTIRVDVRGDARGFALTLGSDPAMDDQDIISYIAIGRASGGALQSPETQDQGSMAGIGTEIALSRVTGQMEDLARRSLGLDVVEIRQDGLKGVTLVAGRYTSRRLFLGFEQPVVFDNQDDQDTRIDDTELNAEYRVNDWLLANLSGSRSLVRFFLGVRHAY